MKEPHILSIYYHLRSGPFTDEIGNYHEELTYSDYEVWEDRPSAIALGRIIHVVAGFVCPACHRTNEPLYHGQPFVCECGLVLTRWGNGLLCTRPAYHNGHSGGT